MTIQQASPQSADPERVERLLIELPAYRSEGRQYRWADGKRRTIEDGLAALLHEAETRASEDRQREIDEERAKADLKTRWERAMQVAHERATEAHYAATLDRQVEQWRRATELRAYRQALEERLTVLEPAAPNFAGARDWLAWINQHIDATDPTANLSAMPSPPKFSADDLKPYLGDWSPHGPEAHLHSWQRH